MLLTTKDNAGQIGMGLCAQSAASTALPLPLLLEGVAASSSGAAASSLASALAALSSEAASEESFSDPEDGT